MLKGRKKQSRWTLVDQSFMSLFITFSLIEITNRGSGIIDGLFVSNFLDTDSIASVGIAKTIYSVTRIISGMLTVGTQSRCSHELGKGNIEGFNRIFSSMFFIAAAVSAVCTAALLLWARPLAVLMGASGKGAALADGASLYLRGIGVGLPALILAPFVSAACNLDSAKKRVRRSGIVYFVCNCAFDLIAVKCGFGVFGIGLATALGTYLQLAYLLLHFRTNDRMLRFTKFDISCGEVKDTLLLGTEKALRSLSKVISPTIINRIILLFGGTIAMSAFSVQKDLLSFAEIATIGIADATALQAGVYYGEMNREFIHAIGKTAHKFCFVFLGIVCAIMVIFANPVARIYISEQGELFNMVVFSSVMTGLYAPINGLVRSRISYLNAVKKTRNMQIMTFLSSIVYTIISAFTLGKLFGAYGVLASDLMRVVLLMLTVWIYYAIVTKKLFPSPDDYLALPDSFDLNPGDVISLDIRDAEDVSLVAEQIQLFCRGHKIDSKTGMKAALCFEELAVNIISFGFPKCKGQPGIDLRLVFSKEEMVMRLRDNCPMFDVERYIAQEIEKTEMQEDIRLGLKMIGSLVDNISYVHSLENNNVIVRFPI